MGTLKLTYDDGLFLCVSTFEERHTPRQAGFRWEPLRKCWVTSSIQVAARVKQYADGVAGTVLRRALLTNVPYTGRLIHPPTQRLETYQEPPARFALSRNRSYLALAPGIGKTPISAVIANTLPDHAVTYICPPFLIDNVRREFSRWTNMRDGDGRFTIVADSQLHKRKPKTWRGPQILFVDEAHRFKTLKAKRTQQVFEGTLPEFDRAVFLSGTPMPNRPIELYPVLSYAAPETIDHMSLFDYGRKFCAGFKNAFGHWDFSGRSNMAELSKRVVGTFMYQLSDEVQKLPPLIQEMVLIGEALPVSLTMQETDLLKRYSPEDLMKGLASNGHTATYLRELGTVKAKTALPMLRAILDDEGGNLLVIAYHRDVIEFLERELAPHHPLVIHGDVDKKVRQIRVDEFQNNPKRHLMILQRTAGGVGFNITKADRVVFVEFSWTPSDNEQPYKRAHRYGQKNSVLVQYLLYQDSIDRVVMEVVLDKKRTINQLKENPLCKSL